MTSFRAWQYVPSFRIRKRGNPGGAKIARNAIAPEWMRDWHLALIGAPKTVDEQIKAAASQGVFNTVMTELNIAGSGEACPRRSIKHFGSAALRGFEPYG